MAIDESGLYYFAVNGLFLLTPSIREFDCLVLILFISNSLLSIKFCSISAIGLYECYLLYKPDVLLWTDFLAVVTLFLVV